MSNPVLLAAVVDDSTLAAILVPHLAAVVDENFITTGSESTTGGTGSVGGTDSTSPPDVPPEAGQAQFESGVQTGTPNPDPGFDPGPGDAPLLPGAG